MTMADHLEASLAGLKLPDDLAHLPPARLRRLRDHAFIVMKACDQILAQRVCEPKVGVLRDLKDGERAP